MSGPSPEQTHEPLAGPAERIAAVYAHRRPHLPSALWQEHRRGRAWAREFARTEEAGDVAQ